MLNPPQPTEQEKLVALAQATGFFNKEEISIVREMLDEYFENPVSGEYIWLVYRETPDALPRGFICYGPASMTVGTYDLYWIAVDRAFQDQKIGSVLLQGMEQDLAQREARQVYIETSDKPQYAPTRAFYERRGYASVAHFRDFYEEGDGKVIYFKSLVPR